MKRRTVGGAAGGKDGPQHLAPVDCKVLSGFLPIVKHAAIVKYDDDEPRQPGKVYIETMGSAWKVVLTDPDTCSKLTVVGPTLDDALSLASVLLEAEDTPWEPDPWALSRRKKK